MLRSLVVGLCVLALATTAAAFTDIQGNSTITVSLNIGKYTQVWYQDDSYNIAVAPEPDIVFSGTQGVDWHNTALIGAYSATSSATGAATEGWACGYFEASDGATIFMKSNCDMSGTIATSGDLTSGANTIPTWFTVAVTGWDDCQGIHDPNGFRLGNSGGTTAGWVDDCTPPFAATPGGYGGDGTAAGDLAGPVTPILFGGQGCYPNQDCFQMVGNNGATFDLDAPVGPGTMKFLARCFRKGTQDVAGNYSATLTPTFTQDP
jgi:hypothetical protein